ncbi:RNA methyltransferase tRNA(m5U54)methyltransferase [Diatrype stigma]|uniref:tRNA (guanine(26)-N(2))-dimethyltransferase n=1 Tax=Diatrype stigma TaxID=117547 RepID=A0AAN9V3G8_9PEZI
MASKPQNGDSAASQAKIVTTKDGKEMSEVQEGLARILIPPPAKDTVQKGARAVEEQQQVFYNPIQQFNRDLTVLAIKAYGEETVARKQSSMLKRVKRKRDRSDAGDGRPAKQQESSTALESTTQPGPNVGHEAANGEDTVMTDLKKAESSTEEESTANPESLGSEQQSTSALESQAPGNEGPREEATTNQAGHERKMNPPKFTILDALSATGLRALRYAQELPFVTSVTANDLTPSAVDAIKRNVEHNGVESKVVVTQGDARVHMYSLLTNEDPPKHPRQQSQAAANKYDVIDLDPYGTAATFFDAAVNAIRDDGGLLCVTCTDSGVWATHGYSEKAFALYGGIPAKGFHSHEAGIRLILNGLAATAARQGLAIEPLLSLSIDYYVRIFVKVRKSAASVKFLAGKTMIVYNCDQGCGAYETQLLLRNRRMTNKSGKGVFYKHSLQSAPTVDQHCKHCGSKMHLAGPMYGGPLHSPSFIKKILDDLPNVSRDVYGTIPRIEGMLQTALEETLTLKSTEDEQVKTKEDELAVVEPYPFFTHPTLLARAMHCVCPDEESFRGALRGLGYQVTRSHCKPGSIKTDAPWSVLWHVMREWVRQKQPVKVENISKTSPTYRLLRLGKQDDTKTKDGAEADADVEQNGSDDEKQASKDDDEVDKLEVVFDKALGRDNTKKGLVRYQINPRENWGPLSKASG